MNEASDAIEFSFANGLQGDPAVYSFFPRTGESVLFDLGSIDNLTNKQLLRVRLALVSHTHIDHFIGFDRLLRVNIPHGRTIELVGPAGIIANVRGKLHGYLWNLVTPGQVRFIVHEISTHGKVRSAALVNDNQFEPQAFERPDYKYRPADAPLPKLPAAFITSLHDGTRVEAVVLDHGTPSVAYALQSPCRYRVDKNAMQKLGLEPGPWVRELQVCFANEDYDALIRVDSQTFRCQDLGASILSSSTPKIMGYLTDLAFNWENLKRIQLALAHAEVMICEANFQVQETERAVAKKHLTTRQAALIAAYAKVRELRIFHISNIYVGKAAESIAEARKHFEHLRQLSEDQLLAAINAEIELCNSFL